MSEEKTDIRLSRLETIVETIVSSLQEIKQEIKSESKINWAPIAIGVTIFFTVSGSVATIYNTRITTLNTAVENIAAKTTETEKANVEHRISIQSTTEKIQRLDQDVEQLDERLREVERNN